MAHNMLNRNRFFLPFFVFGMVVLPSFESEARNPPRGPDFDCDGYDDMAIGVRSDAENADNAGSVNILYGSAGGPVTPGMTTLRFDQDTANVEGVAETDDGFGAALAYGDFDGDGYDDLAIGAPGENVGIVEAAGSVNILYGGSGGLSAMGIRSGTEIPPVSRSSIPTAVIFWVLRLLPAISTAMDTMTWPPVFPATIFQ
jgi:hypothetical protein